MRIGICSRYSHHEATYCALLLADWFADREDAVSIYSPRKPVAIGAGRWDRAAQISRQSPFSQWSLQQDVIVWTHCPWHEQLEWCRRKSVKTVILSLWHELEQAHQNVYRDADWVLSPSRIASKVLWSRWKIGRSLPLPLVPNLPLFAKDPGQRDDRKLLLPLFDGQARRMEMTVLEIIERALLTFLDASITVAYSASTLARHAYCRLRRLRQRFPGRVHLLSGVPWKDRPLVFQRHNLTLWPTVAESTNLTGLYSLSMGTPLLTFSFPPIDELATPHNSLLAPCSVSSAPPLTVQCRPDFHAYEETLHRGLKYPEELRMLQQMPAADFEQRRVEFHAVMTRVFN